MVISRAVTELLRAIGENPQREGLQDTPERVARFWQEFIDHDGGNADVTFESVKADELVAVRGMKLWSMCEHHLLPFSMDVAVGYLTTERVIGLSKIARIAQRYAHALQVQERFTAQVATSVAAIVKTDDVAVIARGRHLCMEMRGVRTPGEMHTSVMQGKFRSVTALRSEFLALVR
jgi:GTP cyclohydrolase I